MSALIIRMPAEKRERLKQLARAREMSVNKLIDEVATMLLTEFDAETRFRLRAARGAGKGRRALALLEKARGRRAR
ncbi:MAG: toxin-antitoxin system HicB family antitoxin [Gammaproteobacteria bacterium]